METEFASSTTVTFSYSVLCGYTVFPPSERGPISLLKYLCLMYNPKCTCKSQVYLFVCFLIVRFRAHPRVSDCALGPGWESWFSLSRERERERERKRERERENYNEHLAAPPKLCVLFCIIKTHRQSLQNRKVKVSLTAFHNSALKQQNSGMTLVFPTNACLP